MRKNNIEESDTPDHWAQFIGLRARQSKAPVFVLLLFLVSLYTVIFVCLLMYIFMYVCVSMHAYVHTHKYEFVNFCEW